MQKAIKLEASVATLNEKHFIMVAPQEENLSVIQCIILINIIKYCTCFLTEFQYRYSIYDIGTVELSLWLQVHTQLIGSWVFQLQDHSS